MFFMNFIIVLILAAKPSRIEIRNVYGEFGIQNNAF